MTSEWYEREKHESRQDLKAVGTDEKWKGVGGSCAGGNCLQNPCVNG